jgi:DNA-directed RNA polymerase subunit M/transcription elongation factor TFIIS
MAKVRKVLFCPECNSTDMYYEMGGITGIIYHCKRCNYIGPLVIEEEIDEDELQAMVQKEEGLPNQPAEKKKRSWLKRPKGES